jgi:hypothetical protein
MQMVKIRFKSREDSAEGIGQLIRRGRVICLRDGIFVVPPQALAVLDSLGLAYEVLVTEGVDHVYHTLRDTLASQVQ